MKPAYQIGIIACALLSACATAKPVPTAKANPFENHRELSSQPLTWQTANGVEAAKTADGLQIIRADLSSSELSLLNPPATDGHSVAEVGTQNGSALVINAAMFKPDYKTSIGYMRNFAETNNGSFNGRLGGYLMFHPKQAGLPAVKVGAKNEISSYDTVFQTYRMWTASDGILWKSGSSIFTQVGLVGTDAKGRVLFFYHPGLIDVHDLVDQILKLNLEITGLLYLDGGFHGSLYLAPGLGDGSVNADLHLPNLLSLKAKH